MIRGVDLLDFYTGRVSIRRLIVLVVQLLHDRTSAVARSIDPIGTQWSSGEWIQAALYDAFTAANFKDPKPYPRPGDAEREQFAKDQRRAALEAQQVRIRARQLAEEGR